LNIGGRPAEVNSDESRINDFSAKNGKFFPLGVPAAFSFGPLRSGEERG
jgi:hypothetical protein